jgi:Mn2+/Fe2+ NRAMP family transporter
MSFGFSLYVLGLILDGLTTKVAFALGLKEASLVYPFMRKHLSENHELILTRIAGIGWGVALLVFFPAPIPVLIFASAVFVPVLMNMISLLEVVGHSSNRKIE